MAALIFRRSSRGRDFWRNGRASVGFLLALLSFKTRGDYLAIITLAFLMIVKSAFENIPYVGGPRGLLGIDKYTTLVVGASFG